MIIRILEGHTSKYDQWYHKYAGKCIDVIPKNMGFYPVGYENMYYITTWHTYPVREDEDCELVTKLDFSVQKRPSVNDAIRDLEKNINRAHEIFRDDVDNVLIANTITFSREGGLDINFNSRN